MLGTFLVGTSGFAYKEWKPDFYPADLKAADFLPFYAAHFPTVEINYTFYREPAATTLDGWLAHTEPGFVFVLKANRKITHIAKLRDIDETLARFLASARRLGDRLGPILFQCPPSLHYDADLLEAFLATLPQGDMPGANGMRYAMEFRHASWGCDEAIERLTKNDVAWCVSDTDEADATPRLTANFAYLRLRKLDYTEAQLRTWAGHIARTLASGADVFAFLKHEDTASGPRFAMQLREMVTAAAPATP